MTYNDKSEAGMYQVSGIQVSEIPVLTTRERALGVTLGLVLIMGVLVALLILAFLAASTTLTASIADKNFRDAVNQMLLIALFLTPAAVAGGYWLALRRLGEVAVGRAWLDTLSLGMLIFSATVGILSAEAALLSTSLRAADGTPAGLLWWLGALFGFPLLFSINIVLALVCSSAGFLCALLFADWQATRTAAPDDHGRLPLALVYAITSAVSVLSFLLFYVALISNTSLTGLIDTMQTTFGTWSYAIIIIIVGIWLIVPAAIIAAVACEHTYRALIGTTPVPADAVLWLRYTADAGSREQA